MHRRNFIRAITGSAILLSGNSIVKAGLHYNPNVKLRFAVASDGHFGEKNTPHKEYYQALVKSVNDFHNSNPLDAFVINGDIIHDMPAFLPEAAKELSSLTMPYYVTRGNHDKVSSTEWENTWKMPLNHSVAIKDQVLILGDTSNEQGRYLPPDSDFFNHSFKQYKNAENIFIFTHITPLPWTKHGIDAKDFQKLLRGTNNVRAFFNGHDHDQDNVKMFGKIPFLFDGHFGGSWGTAHRGFRVVELMENNSMRSFIMDPLNKINHFDSVQ